MYAIYNSNTNEILKDEYGDDIIFMTRLMAEAYYLIACIGLRGVLIVELK
tara:strand:- start:33742 stop:33891 length:150 start_codon:yes stop_codon:yes gene_type:complete